MVDWRQLGEVPDSEDEDSLESQTVDQDLPTLLTTNSSTTVDKEQIKDIWDIPSSQESGLGLPRPSQHANRSTARLGPTIQLDDGSSSPLSLSSVLDLPDIERFVSSKQDNHGTQSTPSAQLEPSQVVEHGISNVKVRIRTPSPDLPDLDDTPHLPRPRSRDGHNNLLPSQLLGEDAEQQHARRVAIQHERSLRVRRPEQLRPYFTESVRFAHEWREHGLRPVRVATEPRSPTRREQSKEPSFDPESQGSNRPGISDESQSQQPRWDGLLFGDMSSSPPRPSPATNTVVRSSQTGSEADTDNTSLLEDDLPSLEELAARNASRSSTKRSGKRKAPLLVSSRKRQREDNAGGQSPNAVPRFVRPPDSPDPLYPEFEGPHQSPNPFSSPTDLGVNDDLSHLSNPNSEQPAPNPTMIIEDESDESPSIQRVRRVLEEDNQESSDEASQSGSTSESGSEIVHRNGRRIKGVLPASWLRLDRQVDQKKLEQRMHRNEARPGDREQRRGVAQIRQNVGGSAMANLLLSDSEEEEDPSTSRRTTDDIFHNQTTLALEEAPAPVIAEELTSDDNMSVVEEDHIDFMLPSGRKRQLQLKDSFQRPPKVARGVSSARPALKKIVFQPRITAAFGTSNSTGKHVLQKRSQAPRSNAPRSKTRKAKHGVVVKTPNRRPPPPELSILDVIEPEAPRFIRIAARAARGRRNQGRASPGKKTIQLATREDHIDAASILRDWRQGSIKPRVSVSSARKAKQTHNSRQPLAERPANTSYTSQTSRQPQASSRSGPRKWTKQVSNGGSVSFSTKDAPRRPSSITGNTYAREERRNATTYRPAQLEVEDRDSMSSHVFHSIKKRLDRLYRRQNATLSIAPSVLSAVERNDPKRMPEPDAPESAQFQKRPSNTNTLETGRNRKKSRPQWVDVDAPQYTHANDPLPQQLPAPLPEVARSEPIGAKLQGLGPYGTQYTRHFEIFPLNRRVYFHDSTLVGSGALDMLASENFCERLKEDRRPISIRLGEQHLRWGVWNSQTASELGIVLDFVADRLDGSHLADVSTMSSAEDAVNFMFLYMKDAVFFDTESEARSFISRVGEVIRSFNERISSARPGLWSETTLRAYDRLLMVACFALKICREFPSVVSEQFAMEELLKSVSRTKLKILSHFGFDRLRHIYGNLDKLQFRERGLRDDSPHIHSWVLLMNALDVMSMPRASFWDLFSEVQAPMSSTTSIDTTVHESLWRNMFTLLPLTDFNRAGVIPLGQRQNRLSDGWTIPQKLLKQVFKVYQDNSRQSPSFNSYCRALVGRCYYLVRHWGWLKSSGIIGVIFDFFGSQNLAHLRNEEFYSSPRFLEQLSQNPTIDVEPEDRCFHIFLKLLAWTIQKMKAKSLMKDIRNLVTRTVPNHNRQYLKDQHIHERDLAALRNHHDLLCTLFWAAPADLRPSADLISKLVEPQNSHKEACLISCRAWSQLARFVVASGEAVKSMSRFNVWRNTFFQQLIHQFHSVAADVREQLLSMSKDAGPSIKPDMIDAMVSMNKAAIMDVLYLSASASLDVMRHAVDLETASFALSTVQLQEIFKHFSMTLPDLDWSILRVALATLDSFLTRIDEFKDNEASQQTESQILDSAAADDAVLVLSHEIATSFFSMARRILTTSSQKDAGHRNTSPVADVDRASCVEATVSLAARLGLRFIGIGEMGLTDMFKRGKYGMFEDMPVKLGLETRRYLTLFVTTLLKQGFDEFGADLKLIDLWMMSIVKPREGLAFENKFAEQLIRNGKDFVPEAVIGLSINPDYGSNRDLFEFAISSMRRSIRDADISQRKSLLSSHTATLKLVMHQLKSDLKMVSENRLEHPNYVSFVRDIISLIKAHGSEMGSVDDYFYQISKEYSPPAQDAKLQVAGMVSYGLRLAEGDTKVVYQLFYFLFNNFKRAVMDDRVDEEVEMLRKGMRDPGILGFVLEKMLPAVIGAAAGDKSAFPLVDVYVQACHGLLDDGLAPLEIPARDLSRLNQTLAAVVNGMTELGQNARMSTQHLHLTRQLLGLLNMIWPSLYALRYSNLSAEAWNETRLWIKRLREVVVTATGYLQDTLEIGDDFVNASVLFRCLQSLEEAVSQTDGDVTSFRKTIITDVKRDWIITGSRLTIQALGKVRNTQSTQAVPGVELPQWENAELVKDLLDQCRVWYHWWEKVFGGGLQLQSRFIDLNLGVF